MLYGISFFLKHRLRAFDTYIAISATSPGIRRQLEEHLKVLQITEILHQIAGLNIGREPLIENLIISIQVTFAPCFFLLILKNDDNVINDNVIYKWPYLCTSLHFVIMYTLRPSTVMMTKTVFNIIKQSKTFFKKAKES
ncbi:11327_t:CDS:2 [Funneliformis mosseae]|uniref:11327_t:CDS:1 n=1 Tax=Funneliformis mosseae TaxID=27381 RepID=A0A9N9FIM2_FUNMO|nr:11327_t:CDS:2 [Funneliformis mosseae]